MAAIGEMIYTMVFSNPTQTSMYGGGTTATYVPFVTTKGSLRQRSSRKLLETGEVIVSRVWESECHFQPDLLSSIDEKTRVSIDGMDMLILGIDRIDHKKFYYRFTLSNG